MRMLHELSGRDTPLHRLDPRTKLTLTVVVVVLSLILPGYRTLLILAALVVLYGLAATITPLDYRNVITLLIPFSIAVTLVQVMVAAANPADMEVVARIGGVPIKSVGIERGLAISLRALILGISFALFMAMTHPMDLTQAATRAGLPFRYAYMIGFSLRFLPLFADEFVKIRQAQASRGLDEERYGPLTKIIALPALLFPLIMDALRRADDIALALEMRGLSTASLYGRTFLNELRLRTADYLIIAAALGALVLVVAGRVSGVVV